MRLSNPRRRFQLIAPAIAMAALLAACSGSAAATPVAPAPASAAPVASSSAASAAAAGGGAVSIKDFAFGPASLSVPVGTTVTWTNGDSARHTVTAVDGSFDSKPIAGGGTFSQAFPIAGTYAYHCTIHSSMTATIVVQ